MQYSVLFNLLSPVLFLYLTKQYCIKTSWCIIMIWTCRTWWQDMQRGKKGLIKGGDGDMRWGVTGEPEMKVGAATTGKGIKELKPTTHSSSINEGNILFGGWSPNGIIASCPSGIVVGDAGQVVGKCFIIFIQISGGMLSPLYFLRIFLFLLLRGGIIWDSW